MDAKLIEKWQLVGGTDFREQEFTKLGYLGNGNSMVYEVIYKGQRYAMKEINVKIENMSQEVDLMMKLKNNNFAIQLIDYMILKVPSTNGYENENFITSIIMEKGQQSLRGYVERHPEYIETAELIKIFEILIQGFAELQQQNIAHRDIKPENILVMEPFALKACDIGSAILYEKEGTRSVVGTLAFLAPELFQPKTNTAPFKSDVFSLGLCFVYLITKQKWIQSRITEMIYTEVLLEWLDMVDRICAKDIVIKGLLQEMLQMNPDKRPDFIQLLDILNQKKQQKLQDREKRFPRLQQLTIIISPTSNQTDDFQSSSESPEKNVIQQFAKTDQFPQLKNRQYSQINLNVQKSPSQSRNSPASRSKANQKSGIERFENDKPSSAQKRQLYKSKDKGTTALPKITPMSQFGPSATFSQSHSGLTLSRIQVAKLTPQYPPRQTRPLSKQIDHKSASTCVTQPKTPITLNPQLVYSYESQHEFDVTKEQMIDCDVSEVAKFDNVSYLSLQNRLQNGCVGAIPLSCQYLYFKIDISTQGLQIEPNNQIQTLIIDLKQDNKIWAENLRKFEYPQLENLEIINQSPYSQIDKIIMLLSTKISSLVNFSLFIIGSKITEEDHKLLIAKVNSIGCRQFTLQCPNNQLNIESTRLHWTFNTQVLTSLHINYSGVPIKSFNSLFRSIQGLRLQTLYLDISKFVGEYYDIIVLIQYISEMPLRSLTLIFNSVHQFKSNNNSILKRLVQALPKIYSLTQLYLSFTGVSIDFQDFKQLFKSLDHPKWNSIELDIDRIAQKQAIIEIHQNHKELPNLTKFKIDFLTTQQTMKIFLYKRSNMPEISNSKCNQGQQIKSSKMYICVPCSQKHQCFLKHPVYICALCIKTCHLNICDEASMLQSMSTASMTNSLVSSQVFNTQTINSTTQRRSKMNLNSCHTHVESYDLNFECYCLALGMCRISKIEPCHGKSILPNILHFYCEQCQLPLCPGCKTCHEGHPTIEMYIGPPSCQCKNCLNI